MGVGHRCLVCHPVSLRAPGQARAGCKQPPLAFRNRRACLGPRSASRYCPDSTSPPASRKRPTIRPARGRSRSERSSSPPRCGFFADPTRNSAGTGRSRWRFASSTSWSAPGHTLSSATRCTLLSCLWALGQAFLLSNWVAGLAGLIGFAVLFFLRVDKEERMMLENFGPQYRAYMERTKRIIPYLY